MLELVGNPDDRFSHDEAHIASQHVQDKSGINSFFNFGLKPKKIVTRAFDTD